MYIFLLSISYADNPCYDILHAKGAYYDPHARCTRSIDYDEVDAVYTCNMTRINGIYTCQLSVSDIECPYKSILAIAINQTFKDVSIKTIEVPNNDAK